MKIYHKKELMKGYIPNDKVRHNGIAYEDIGFDYFGIKFDTLKEEWDKVKFKGKEELNLFINTLKLKLLSTEKMKEIIEENYHKSFYINFNMNFPQLFIER